MKLIRIDEDVWNYLKSKAIPLEDNPNSIIRRLLGLDGDTPMKNGGAKAVRRIKKRRRGKRLPKGSGRTDQKEFLIPILNILDKFGGKAEAQHVFKELEGQLRRKFHPVDSEKLKSGQVRWVNTARWARNELVSDGLVSKESERGIWEITDKGRQYLTAKV